MKKPNYNFERAQREKAKEEKAREKAQRKKEQQAQQSGSSAEPPLDGPEGARRDGPGAPD